MKTACDKCGKKLRGNGYGARRAERPWWVCGCGATTILDPAKEWAEWKCRDCGNCWTERYPVQCVNCGCHPSLQKFVRYVSVAEIEA